MIRMLGNRVLIDPQRSSDLKRGIYTGVPTTTFTQHEGKDEQICTGRVVAVGNGKRDEETAERLSIGGDEGVYVAFSDTCHRKAGIPGEDYLYIRNDDIMLISDEPFEHVEVIY